MAEGIKEAQLGALARLGCPTLQHCEGKQFSDFNLCYQQVCTQRGFDLDALPKDETRWDVLADVIYTVLHPTGPSATAFRRPPDLDQAIAEVGARLRGGELTEQDLYWHGLARRLVIRTVRLPTSWPTAPGNTP